MDEEVEQEVAEGAEGAEEMECGVANLWEFQRLRLYWILRAQAAFRF